MLGHGLVLGIGLRHTVFPVTHLDLDTTDSAAVHKLFRQIRPDAIIHTAAIPDPDVCETNPDLAFSVNVEGTRHSLEAAREVGAWFVFISSDSIFDGLKKTPYVESDLPSSSTVYGRTKILGEQIVQSLPNHLIFRIPILFGPGKINFIEKGLQRIIRGEEYIVASDQMGSALNTLDAASKILEVMEAGACGIFHLSNAGACTRLELARRAASLAGLDLSKIIGKPLEEMGRPAKRLKYAVMEMRALKQGGFSLLRPWEDALADYIRSR